MAAERAEEDGQPAGLPQYQLADVLGRGAFGVVSLKSDSLDCDG